MGVPLCRWTVYFNGKSMENPFKKKWMMAGGSPYFRKAQMMATGDDVPGIDHNEMVSVPIWTNEPRCSQWLYIYIYMCVYIYVYIYMCMYIYICYMCTYSFQDGGSVGVPATHIFSPSRLWKFLGWASTNGAAWTSGSTHPEDGSCFCHWKLTSQMGKINTDVASCCMRPQD